MLVLETRGLAKRYGDLWALGGVDLAVEKGEVFGFLGPNGAGKTTFTKCVTGFVRPNQGDVRILGIDARAHPVQVARHIGLVPDQYDFYGNLTGRQHLDFYGRLYGVPREQRKARIEEVLGLVRMENKADKRVKGYSHGMKQRICIAQAMLNKPDLILFDEPTNGLDPKGAYELRMMIKDLAKDGTTVFLNSHLLHEVEQTCERVAILDRGKLKAVSKISDLRRMKGAQTEIRVLNPAQKQLTALAKVIGSKPQASDDRILIPGGPEETAAAVAALVRAGAKITSVVPAEASLESVFLELTEDRL